MEIKMEDKIREYKKGRLTHIPCFSKTPYRRTAIPFQPIVEQAKKEYQKLLSQSNTAICQYPLQYP
jgi:hypothetical protein